MCMTRYIFIFKKYITFPPFTTKGQGFLFWQNYIYKMYLKRYEMILQNLQLYKSHAMKQDHTD